MSHRDDRGRGNQDVRPGRRGFEGWERGRRHGGFGSQYDAWSQGAGFGPRSEDHRGRGPRTYRRSDERILEEACERLTDDRSVDATHVTVVVDDGEVTLSGTVPSRRQKRLAEECVESIRGVHDVINQLKVSRDEMLQEERPAERSGMAADRGRR
jgi:hypothetical protein